MTINEKLKLYEGACEDILKTLPDKSVDAVICDPPYGTLKVVRKDAFRLNQWDTLLNYRSNHMRA